MTEAGISTIQPIGKSQRVSEGRRIIKVMFSRPVVVFGTVIIVGLLALAIFAPLLAPYDPYEQNLRVTLAQPSPAYRLGTDDLGRDVLSRIIYGSRISLLVGIVATGMGAGIGMALGLTAGHFGGWIDTIIMRFTDSLMAIPSLVLTIAISSALGPGVITVLIAIGVALMPTYTRMMCGQILSLKETDYVTAVRVIGGSNLRIMLRHLFPNAFPPLLVLITLNLGTVILMEASLSFLGIGIVPPIPTWGGMVATGYKFMLTNPVLSFAPGIVLLLVVVAFNMVGDGLRDALDPRLRGRI